MKTYPIIVLGAGAGGLVVAIGATKAGKKVLLVEKGNYGGDCTNFGCIPSKSLIASAHSAACIKGGQDLGLEFSSKSMETRGALDRVRKIIEEVRFHEEPNALNKMGLETLTGTAKFVDPHTLEINGEKIYGKQIVIATGSSPFIPPVKGLENTPFLTNETIFDCKEVPKSLVILGGGPIGSELAQAFLRLGSKVTLIHSHTELLNKEDPLAQEILASQFKVEGMKLILGTNVRKVTYQQNSFYLDLEDGTTLESQALLVSVGRRPSVSSLNLEAAGIVYTDKGIKIDAYGRTSQSHIWAVGDVTGAPFFTHWAESQGRAVLTSLLLPFKKKFQSKEQIPRVTFTDPEIASVGLSEKEASSRYTIATYTVPFSNIDRAITAGRTEGFVKIVTKKWSSKILGCTIVGERAGEMIGEVLVAMHAGIPLRKLADIIHPYPTYNLAIRKAADLWLTQTILTIFKRRKNEQKNK